MVFTPTSQLLCSDATTLRNIEKSHSLLAKGTSAMLTSSLHHYIFIDMALEGEKCINVALIVHNTVAHT